MHNKTQNKQLPACCHTREDGTRCKATPQTGKKYCFFHDPALKKKRAAAQRAGGIACHAKPARPILPPRELKTPADVYELLSESMYLLSCGEVDPEYCYTIGFLSKVLLDAMESAEPEERHARGETIPENQSPFEPQLNDLRSRPPYDMGEPPEDGMIGKKQMADLLFNR